MGTVEEGNGEHAYTRSQAHGDAGKKGLFRSVEAAGSDILGHEGTHGLHEGAGNQHDETADFL